MQSPENVQTTSEQQNRPQQSRRNVGYALMRTIANYGIDTVFGIPGTHNLEFYRHLPELGLRPVTARHEQGAGYAADAWAQRTRLPGVILATSGPGTLNALSAAGTAYCESRPLLILSPGAPRGSEGTRTGILHETRDQVGAVSSVIGKAYRIQSAEEGVKVIHEAFAQNRVGRPGPVYIEVPLDLLESPCDLPDSLFAQRDAGSLPELPADALESAVEALAHASRPAMLLGSGARPAADDLRALAERLGAPIVTSSNGKGIVSEHHPLSIGAELRLKAAVDVLNSSDCLLIVGSKVAAGEFAAAELNPSGTVIRIDVDPQQLRVNVTPDISLATMSDVAVPEFKNAVLTHSSRQEPSAPWVDLDAVRNACRQEADSYVPEVGVFAQKLVELLPDNTIVTGDSSQVSYAGIATHFRAPEPATCLNMITYATLGYGIPAAIGAKLASPDRPVVCISGDGALMFSVQELITAAEQQLDITVVCFDNGGYGEIEQNEQDRDIDPIGVRLTQPNWPLLANAFGGKGFAVTAQDEFNGTIQKALNFNGVSLVHVRSDIFA